MINKIKGYVGFFAAAFSIISTGFFYDHFAHDYSGSENVSSAYAWWFALASIALWALWVVLYFLGKPRKRKK